MSDSPMNLTVHRFQGRDGTALAYREVGEGRPLVLIHGFFSTAMVNWVRYGHAAAIAGRGYRVIMPDLRGHGDSAKPHVAAAYPPDVLADDGFALIEHLGLASYDLGGYSLGARTTLRMLVRGAAPGRAIVAGMGLEGIVRTGDRGAHFRRILTHLGTFARGSADWMAEQFLKTVGGDPQALLHILDTFVDTPPEALALIGVPTLVVAGAEDADNGSAEALAAALPNAQSAVVPGNHMTAVTKPQLGTAIADFLGGGSVATLAFKVMTADDCAAFESGVFHGAPVDRADGYIHLSTAAQLAETVARHFAGQTNLTILAVDLAALGDAVRWEPSRGGQLFPHLYAPLTAGAVVGRCPLQRVDGNVRLAIDTLECKA